MAIVLDGSSLALPDVVRAAHGEGVTPDPAALARVRDTQRAADAVALTREVYGRSTGVGANRTVVIDPAATDTGMALLRSHAVSAGPPRSAERVRATVVVRANQLLAAGSGASGELVEGLFALLADDDLPPVREFGGVGTGDLGALATVGLALARRGVRIGAGDALPLMSSNAATLADAALAVHALTALSDAALEVAAATFVVVDGNPEAFALPVERATPFAGARQVARTMRALTAGHTTPVRIQDPFALRTLPQVHGAWVDSLTRAADVVDQLVNAPTENPLFLAGADVAHHGGFHGAPLTAALDTVRLTAIGAMRLSRARLTALCEPALTTLTPFLGNPLRAGASGVIGLEYVAGSALGDLHMLAHPAATTSVVVSRGLEEDASFASMAARAALQAVAACRTVVAAELLTALRALAMRGRPLPERFAGLAAELGDDLDDRDLTDDLDRVVAALGG